MISPKISALAKTHYSRNPCNEIMKMVINHDHTHELNIHDAYSNPQHISGSNYAANATLVSTNIYDIV